MTLYYYPLGARALSDSTMTSFKFEIEKIRKKAKWLAEKNQKN